MSVWVETSALTRTVALAVAVMRFGVPTSTLGPVPLIVAVMAVMSRFVPFSVVVTVPAGTLIGMLHAPTGTLAEAEKPPAPVTVKVKVPVKPEPGTACLQISRNPLPGGGGGG